MEVKMREIKFRGMHKDALADTFVYGYLGEANVKGYMIITPSGCSEKVSSVVPSDSVGQFTGIIDKNGKEIYVGDFVKAPFDDLDEYKEIYFAKGIFGYGGFVTPLSEFHSDDLEIVGNTYENPDMDKDDVNVLTDESGGKK
jgi:hypothetical protein